MLMNDKEYAITYFDKDGGFHEIVANEQTRTGAKAQGEELEQKGATKVTVKLFEDGDLRHQWDLTAAGWVQYE